MAHLYFRGEYTRSEWEAELFRWNWTKCYGIKFRDTSFQKSRDLYVHSLEDRERKKEEPHSLGNNRPWKWLWEREAEVSRNHQKSRELFKDWLIHLTLHISKSHDKYFCKWSSTGHSWISTELFSTKSLDVRAPDYLDRSSQADALKNKNRLFSRIQFALRWGGIKSLTEWRIFQNAFSIGSHLRVPITQL